MYSRGAAAHLFTLLWAQHYAVLQVPLLLGLGKEERALGAALDSGDADLAYLALFRMQRTLPLQQFLAVLAGKPQARSLFSAYCAHTVWPVMAAWPCPGRCNGTRRVSVNYVPLRRTMPPGLGT